MLSKLYSILKSNEAFFFSEKKPKAKHLIYHWHCVNG